MGNLCQPEKVLEETVKPGASYTLREAPCSQTELGVRGQLATAA